MAIDSSLTLEEQLAASVARFVYVRDALAGRRMAEDLPEPDVTPQAISVVPPAAPPAVERPR
jgi:hypothetical protein